MKIFLITEALSNFPLTGFVVVGDTLEYFISTHGHNSFKLSLIILLIGCFFFRNLALIKSTIG